MKHAILIFLMGVIVAGAQEEATVRALPMLERDEVTGDWAGARSVLREHGVELFGAYTADFWGNTSGGVSRGVAYNGLLDFGVEVDLKEAVGWEGARFNTTWLWLSGRDASADLVGNLFTISNLAGFDTLRMSQLWFEQNFWGEVLSVRAGQILADSEFAISDYAGLFINGTFGWPALASLNLPEGGPAYPMGTLGARVRWTPIHWLSFQSAVFQGNVFAQDVNRYGFRWRLDAENGFSFFSELQARWNHAEGEKGLPGQVKVGAWFQTGAAADALADSTSSGNSGYYAILDQLVFREPAPGVAGDGKTCAGGKSFKARVDAAESDQGLGCFARVGFAPADRNFLSFYCDAGVTYKGLIPTRDQDTLGCAFAYGQLSSGGRISVAEEGFDPAGAEMVLEVSYQAQITPALILQPDIQYVIQPGARSDLGNALVIGGRASITF